jgi:serine/threonine protein kinase/tetratricopeptide (TPR) repeat protein
VVKPELSGIPTAAEAPEIVGVPEAGPLAAGRVLGGRYEIRSQLGEGGMGAVYGAYDRELQEHIALKIIFTARRGHTSSAELQLASTVRAVPFLAGSDVVDKGGVERLRREVKLARQITHPNVCRVFDIGESDGLYFLTMELIEGRTLRQWLAGGPLQPDQALHFLEQIAEGLSAAHAQGIVHGDLKPENVLVREDGRAVVADFGISRKLHLDVAEKPRREGTPAYMSPEQLRGESIDVRSDVFTLGVVGFELLAGRRPLSSGAQEAGSQAIDAELLRQLDVPGLSQPVLCALHDVFARALASEPQQRFQSAAGFSKALSDARRATPAHSSLEGVSKPEAIPPRAPAAQPRRGVSQWLFRVLLVLTALAAIGFGSWSTWHESSAGAADGGERGGTVEAGVPTVAAPPPTAEMGMAGVRVAMAVLPFENRTREVEGDALARTAQESIAAGLRTIPHVRLPDTVPADRVQAKAQGIVFLVHGSVTRMGSDLRVRAEIEAVDDADRVPIVEPIEPLGIDTERGNLSESLEVLRMRALDEAQLAVQYYQKRQRVVRGTTNDTARAKLLQYYAMVGPAPRREHFEIGVGLLNDAIGADPDYVPALVERGYLQTLGSGRADEQIALATTDLDRAAQKGPDDASVAVMRCRVLQVQVTTVVERPTDAMLTRAREACQNALRLDPASAYVYIALARIHDALCQDEDALRLLDRSGEIDRSLSGRALRHLVSLALENDRLQVANRVSEQLLAFAAEEQRLGPRALSRRAGMSPVQNAHFLRGAVLLRLGRLDEARAALERELAQIAKGAKKDTQFEAAAIRGITRVARQQHEQIAPALERRLNSIEAEYRSAMKSDPASAMPLSDAYSFIDPQAAVEWLLRMPPPASCSDAVYRALVYITANRRDVARKTLEACTPVESWETSCVEGVRTRLSE